MNNCRIRHRSLLPCRRSKILCENNTSRQRRDGFLTLSWARLINFVKLHPAAILLAYISFRKLAKYWWIRHAKRATCKWVSLISKAALLERDFRSFSIIHDALFPCLVAVPVGARNIVIFSEFSFPFRGDICVSAVFARKVCEILPPLCQNYQWQRTFCYSSGAVLQYRLHHLCIGMRMEKAEEQQTLTPPQTTLLKMEPRDREMVQTI